MSGWLAYNTQVVLAGVSLLGICAGVVGCFAFLQRRSLTGDALAHASLPGLCLAFIIVGERNLPAMLTGALVTGLLGITLIAFLRRWTRIKEDAALGFVLGVFYGLGAVLLRVALRMEEGDKSGLESYILGDAGGMPRQDVQLIAGLALATLLVTALLFKELRLVAFDAGFARVQGWPTLPLDLLLMGLVVLVVVIGLPAVGVLLMAGMLIIPPVSARFWTDNLARMMLLSALFGMTSGVIGTLLSASELRLPAGPSIILVGAGIFVVSLVLAPRRGWLAQFLSRRRGRTLLLERRFLCALYDLAEPRLLDPAAISLSQLAVKRVWSPGQLAALAAQARRKGWIERAGDGLHLTERGRARAADEARTQRLWELFLQEFPDQAAGLRSLDMIAQESELPVEVAQVLRERLQAAGRWPTTRR